MIFFATWRDRLPLMVAMPDFRRSADTSLSTTSKPASAATCAMPLPIWPEPITPTLLIITVISSRSNAQPLMSRPAPSSHKTPASICSSGRCFQPSSLSELGQRFRQFRNSLIQVGDETVIGDLEYRRVLVLVDGDDHLGILHAGEMLDRAGYADGDIEFRRHHLAGLADLPVVRRIARVHGGARGADAGAKLVGERLDIFGKVLAALHGASAGDDDLGRGQLRSVALGDFLADKRRQARIGRRRRALHRRTAALAGRGEG